MHVDTHVTEHIESQETRHYIYLYSTTCLYIKFLLRGASRI